MKALLLPVIGTLTLSAASMAQVPECTHYQRDFSFGRSGNEAVSGAITTTSGVIVVVGSTESAGAGSMLGSIRHGGMDGLVMATDDEGNLLWSTVLGGSGTDDLFNVAEIPGGDLLVVGKTNSLDGDLAGPSNSSRTDGWYARLHPDGSLVWSKRVGVAGGWSGVNDLAVSATDAVLATTWIPGIRIDFNGNVLATSENFRGERIVLGADGSYLVQRNISTMDPVAPFLSEGEGGNSIDESGVLNVNADGTINWVNRLKTTSIAFTSQLAAVADGYLIVVDSYNGSVAFERTAPVHGLSDWWVVRLDLSGNIMWDKAFGNEGNDYAVSILPKPDGGFLIAGRVEDRPEPGPTNDVTEASRGFADLWVVRTDALGGKVWDKRWGGAGEDKGCNIVRTPTGYALISTSNSSSSADHRSYSFGNTDVWWCAMEPGVPGHWYPDGDGDGFGLHGVAAVDVCEQPLGYAENDLDCDDAVPNVSNVYLGATCSDMDIYTLAFINEGCACIPFTIDPALLRPMELWLLPDDFPGDITWEVREVVTHNLIMSGGPYPNAQPGVPITSSVLVPPVTDQRYQLTFFDEHADGIPGGGYTLSVDGKPVIIADGKYYQTSRTDTVADFFDVPMGTTKMKNNSCGREDLGPNSVVQAKPNDAVSFRYSLNEPTTGYEFWVFDPHGGYSRRVFQSNAFPGSAGGAMETRASRLRLSAFGNNPLPLGVQLNIRVRAVVQGFEEPFGPACTLTVLPETRCPITRVEDRPEKPHFSCGKQFPLDGTQTLWAIPRNGVDLYEFEFTDVQTDYEHSEQSGTPSVVIGTWTDEPLLPLHLYDVRVRCSMNGGQSWCPWGKVCKITTGPGVSKSAKVTQPEFHVYPNPAQDMLWISMPVQSEMEGEARVEVIDATGRMVLRQVVGVRELNGYGVALPTSMPGGAYALRISTAKAEHQVRFMLVRP